MMYDAGNYGASLKKALEIASTTRASASASARAPATASCAASASPPISRPAALRRRRRSARSVPVSACGNRRRCRVNPVGTVEVLTGSHSHGQGHETTFAQLVSDARHPDGQCLHRAWRHRQGADGHGHLWLALRCSRHVGDLPRRSTRSSPRARRSPPMCWRRPTRPISSSRTGTSRSRAPTRSWISAPARCRPMLPTSSTGRIWSLGLKEGAFYDPTNFTFPAGVHICELEIDPDTGVDHDRALDGSG